MSLAEQQVVQNEVDMMLRLGVIEPSRSAWSSPIQLIRIKDDTWRFAIDYRNVNTVLKTERWPMS